MKRRSSFQTAVSTEDSGFLLSIFPSGIGWMGILGREMAVSAIVIGQHSAAAARKAACQSISNGESIDPITATEDDWLPELRQTLQDYAEGKRVEFGSIKLELPRHTLFRDKVLAATRALRYGETTTYGELAIPVPLGPLER